MTTSSPAAIQLTTAIPMPWTMCVKDMPVVAMDGPRHHDKHARRYDRDQERTTSFDSTALHTHTSRARSLECSHLLRSAIGQSISLRLLLLAHSDLTYCYIDQESHHTYHLTCRSYACPCTRQCHTAIQPSERARLFPAGAQSTTQLR